MPRLLKAAQPQNRISVALSLLPYGPAIDSPTVEIIFTVLLYVNGQTDWIAYLECGQQLHFHWYLENMLYSMGWKFMLYPQLMYGVSWYLVWWCLEVGSVGGVESSWLGLCPQKRLRHLHSLPCEDTRLCLQARKCVLTKHHIYWHLGSWTSKSIGLWEINICCLSHPVHNI